MATLEDFAKAYLGTYQQPDFAKADPYAPYAGVANSIAQAVPYGDPDYSLQEKLGAALITNLIGGAATGMSDNYQNRARKSYNDVLLGSFVGGPQEKPEVLDDALFESATQAGDMFRVRRGLEAEQAAQERQLDFDTDIKKDLVKTIQQKALSGEYIDPAVIAQFNKGAKKGGGEAPEPVGMAAEESDMIDPLSPRAKEKRAIDSELFDREDALFKDFANKSQRYRYQEEGFQALVEAYKDQSGTSDFELIRRAAQAVEPGLAVRRDDEESLQEAASLFGGYEAAARAALTGESALDPKVRAGMVRIAARALDTAGPNYNKIRDSYIQRADNYGLKVDHVVPYDPARTSAELFPEMFGGTPMAPTGAMGGGMTRELVPAPGESKEAFRSRVKALQGGAGSSSASSRVSDGKIWDPLGLGGYMGGQ